MIKNKLTFLSDEEYKNLIEEAKRHKSQDEKRFIKIGWQLIEAKYRYYKLDAPILEDHQYDLLEREYDELSKKLGLSPTAADMVGFDQNKPVPSWLPIKLWDATL